MRSVYSVDQLDASGRWQTPVCTLGSKVNSLGENREEF